MNISGMNSWVDKKMRECRVDKEQALNEILVDTTEIIRQFLDSPDSKATRGILGSCCKCNELFLEILNGQG